MKRPTLLMQVFLSIVSVSLVAVLASGFIARRALEVAFEQYLAGSPAHMGPGAGMGRHMLLGTAEEAFLAGVDRGIALSAAVAVVLAAVSAFLLARYLVRPLRSLTTASKALADGRLDHDVDEEGPEEVAELASAFNEMADSLARSERLRQRMVGDVAHELRNPIAALRAQVEGIVDGVLKPDEVHMASLMEDVAALSLLVDDLQELSVADAGRLRYEQRVFDLTDLVASETAKAALIAHQGVEVRAEIGDEPVRIYGDAARIAQVLRNILSNAIRHTSVGTVVARVEKRAGVARVAVSDTGEGIPTEDLPHIWERFYRVDVSRSHETGGTGLGLAISKRIIEDHGGRVFATSAVGKGSVIGFEVPIATDAERAL